ncbi:PadR family transcriptional regulator [Actinotalea caeni]
MRRMVPSEDSILTNLRRGALEYCVLASLREGEAYGFDIARRLVADGVLMGGEGTLYPLLARLRKAGLVSTSWQESDAGPPRRYYAITDDGARALDTFRRAWTSFRDAVDLTLEGPR